MSRKVLMVSSSLGFGGADTQIVTLARILRSRGWSAVIASMTEPTAHRETLAAMGVPVHSLGMRPGLPDPRAIFRLAHLVRREQPDLVHAHMYHANLLCRLTRCVANMRALVCTAHNTREISQRGGPTWHKELIYGLTDRLTDRTTIICEAGFRRYVERRAAPAHRLTVIPIGIDCDEFCPPGPNRAAAREALGITDNTFLFLTIGRMAVQKDYPNLLRAFSLIREHPWTLLIGGGGPLEQHIRHLIRDYGMEDRVRLLGVRQDVRDWFHAADAFVMGSAMEGMPVVLLEAAASGLPAVVTNAGGSGEVVVDGETGFVVPVKDHQALAGALGRMLQLPYSTRSQFACAARRRALEQFEIGRIVTRWERLYESCLAGSSRTRAFGTPHVRSAAWIKTYESPVPHHEIRARRGTKSRLDAH